MVANIIISSKLYNGNISVKSNALFVFDKIFIQNDKILNLKNLNTTTKQNLIIGDYITITKTNNIKSNNLSTVLTLSEN